MINTDESSTDSRISVGSDDTEHSTMDVTLSCDDEKQTNVSVIFACDWS